MDTCICMTESLHCSPETVTTLLIGYIPWYIIGSLKRKDIYIYPVYKYAYIYTMEYYSVINKMKFAICSNMDGLGGYYAKWNKTEKDKYCMISLLCEI